MDYKEFSEETISEQDKAFAQEFANFVNGRNVFRRAYRQRTDQSTPLSPATDVQGLYRFYTPVGTQLSKRVVDDERNKWASHLAAMAYDRLTEDNLIYDPEYTNFKKQ